jgi:hypothetical protein
MDWRDVINIAGLIVTVGTFVYAVYYNVTSDVRKRRESANRLISEMSEKSAAAREQGRVLLTFDRKNAAKPGTLENAYYRYAEAMQPRDVFSPDSYIELSEGLHADFLKFTIAPIVGILVLWARAYYFGYVSLSSDIEARIYFFVLVGITLLLVYFAYRLLRAAYKESRRFHAATEYLEYLNHREISFGQAITQSKKVFDREHAAGPAA